MKMGTPRQPHQTNQSATARYHLGHPNRQHQHRGKINTAQEKVLLCKMSWSPPPIQGTMTRQLLDQLLSGSYDSIRSSNHPHDDILHHIRTLKSVINDCVGSDITKQKKVRGEQ
mmetsp:Transcript_5748/g.10338  ORF Transcript_5748/g.10338 Transcript_5748/m.10338 type:complete len:114 (+) Transcript_5748:901-1242(+)